MADTVTATITATIKAHVSQTYADGASSVVEPSISYSDSLAAGTGSDQCDEVWSASQTVTAAAFDNHDLTSLTQKDSAGATIRTGISFGEVKSILIHNTTDSGTGGYLLVGGGTDGAGALDAFTGSAGEGWLEGDGDKLSIPPESMIAMNFPDGVTVTDTSNDVLCVAAVTQDQAYKIIIVGVAS